MATDTIDEVTVENEIDGSRLMITGEDLVMRFTKKCSFNNEYKPQQVRVVLDLSNASREQVLGWILKTVWINAQAGLRKKFDSDVDGAIRFEAYCAATIDGDAHVYIPGVKAEPRIVTEADFIAEFEGLDDAAQERRLEQLIAMTDARKG